MKRSVLVVTLLVTAGAAIAASSDMPKRKSGLWEITVSSNSAKGSQTMQQCVDEKSDDMMKNNMAGTEKQSCSKNEFRREGTKLITESVCKMSGSTATTRGVFTGQFDSSTSRRCTA